EPFHVDDERGLVGIAFGKIGRELEVVGDHANPCAGSQTAFISVRNAARLAPTSIGAGGFLLASAASAPCSALPARLGGSAATACISFICPLQCRTTSQPAAIAAHVRSAIEPDSAPIEMSSLISRPLNPIESRITSCTIVAETVAGSTGSSAVNTTCAVIPMGRPASGRKAAKSVASSTTLSVLTTGSLAWLSAV